MTVCWHRWSHKMGEGLSVTNQQAEIVIMFCEPLVALWERTTSLMGSRMDETKEFAIFHGHNLLPQWINHSAIMFLTPASVMGFLIWEWVLSSHLHFRIWLWCNKKAHQSLKLNQMKQMLEQQNVRFLRKPGLNKEYRTKKCKTKLKNP